MQVIITTAPDAYDYGYVYQLTDEAINKVFDNIALDEGEMYRCHRADGNIRVVVCASPNDARYQADRYSSGMYLSIVKAIG